MAQCEAIKRDGAQCKAHAVAGKAQCAGHLGLGVAAPDAQGLRAKAVENRIAAVSQRVERRKKTALDHAADALERNGRALADGIVSAAERGDWRAAAFLYERVYGKPQERLTLDVPVDPLQVATMSVEERAALQARILEEHPELSALVPRRTPDVQRAKKSA